jgi:hypothetical protein
MYSENRIRHDPDHPTTKRLKLATPWFTHNGELLFSYVFQNIGLVGDIYNNASRKVHQTKHCEPIMPRYIASRLCKHQTPNAEHNDSM